MSRFAHTTTQTNPKTLVPIVNHRCSPLEELSSTVSPSGSSSTPSPSAKEGFSECARVAQSRVVFFTNDYDICARFWLFDYFPELLRVDRQIFPSIERFAEAFEAIEIREVPIPDDCLDGFLCAYWKRPRAYLDSLVRASISTFHPIKRDK